MARDDNQGTAKRKPRVQRTRHLEKSSTSLTREKKKKKKKKQKPLGKARTKKCRDLAPERKQRKPWQRRDSNSVSERSGENGVEHRERARRRTPGEEGSILGWLKMRKKRKKKICAKILSPRKKPVGRMRPHTMCSCGT